MEKYVRLCSTCSLRKPQATQPPLRPIVANGLFSRVQVSWHSHSSRRQQYCFLFFMQIDLIDMRHMPHNGQKWILHIVDHWSKFHLAFPITSKSAIDVAHVLQKHVFPVFGLPSILHSDNGREFVNKLIGEVVSMWPGQVQLVSGRPRHPQSQGLIEQAHYTLERMISAKVVEDGSKSPPWTNWLPYIVCKYNNLKKIKHSCTFC